jgi:hypothetical protein
MKRIYITLGERIATYGELEDKGDFIILDWENKQVIDQITFVGRQKIEKSRSSGPSGLDFFDGFLYVACRNDLIALNPDTYKEDHRINLVLGGVHQIKSFGDNLFLSSTYRNVKQVVRNQKVIDVVPTLFSGIESDTKPAGCFNAITFAPNGDEYHLYSGPKIIYNFSQRKIAYRVSDAQAPHDLCFINNNEVLYTRSILRHICKINFKTQVEDVIFESPIPFHPDPQNDFNFYGFMRGLAFDKKTNKLYAMSNPATIYEIDCSTWQIIDSMDFLKYELSKEELRKRCPFDLILDPRDW